jgi:hypothetical protein
MMAKVYIGSGLDNQQFLIAANFVRLNLKFENFELYTDQNLEPWFKKKVSHRLKLKIIEFNYSSFVSFWSGLIAIFFLPALLLIFIRPRNLLYFYRLPWINILLHSIYDTAYRYSPIDSIRPTVWQLSLATIRCSIAMARANSLAKKEFNYYISGHNVYQFKIFNYILSKSAPVYIQGRSNLRKLNPDDLNDSPLCLPPNFNLDSAGVLDKDALSFWDSRRSGGTKNEEFILANSGAVLISARPINIVFCHVFHDSAFFSYPGPRLFLDFVDWIVRTLKICASTKEDWLFRLHPSASSWGEDSRIILQRLISKHAPNAQNIKIIENEYSVESLIERAKRIVTYSGTVQLEAAIMGKRPIIACGGILAQYAPDCAFIPLTHSEYLNFLKGDFCYELSPDRKLDLLKLMYVNEYCRSYEGLLGLSKRVGGITDSAEVDRLILSLEKYSNTLEQNANTLFDKGYLWFCSTM